ncbi:cell wall-active antibiotics response protein LiaF [Salisediminibacterium halotolerans]|uniref:Lia operon protein LiaF n=1 Tax=Salisediminibacterium halotolerans TaxID=517425 RepID=A0A1H9R790_9BACI|nr:MULTISPECIES: cell wall-active antibiotics response protein LiaF [Salisediminibacterium]RLJ78251.1 lia operon protein LiaF [Actinophytocola xinjiangensis]RPE88410.1 lia operon protein LiaF [Salisediminibacterium halotolerans]TWG37228.1 lia operon protein LiaF [Salisediminibacterium halotolerans]SER68405.1 lia operon protein LiaF [Salisediminibacterium haloalkalitolerans]GEL07162.1 hypothetical protein SHA02_05780 [Salisediminibacterium halotolerans]
MKKILAVFFLILGVVYLLVNVGLADEQLLRWLSTYWPLIIVIFGLKVLLEGIGFFLRSLRRDRKHIGRIVWGIVIIGAGLVIFGGTADFFDFSAADLWGWLWPLILIYIAFKLLVDRDRGEVIELDPETAERHKQNVHPRAPVSEYRENQDRPDFHTKKQHTMFGDIKIGKNPWEPDGFDVHIGMGDVKIDFAKALLYEGDNEIKIGAWIGDIKLTIPDDIPVKINAEIGLGDMKIFGDKQGGVSRNTEYKSPNFDTADRRLVLSCKLGMGDIKILEPRK